jgi:hypothetical protein
LISFPPGTEMFQFPGFALLTLWIQVKSTWFNRRSSDVPAVSGGTPTGQGPARSRASSLARRHHKHLTISDCQVGFPIRTSRDQRVLSPPPGLSQSATSFIASCCQGIHQTPFSRLIRSRSRRALLPEGVQTSTRCRSGRKSTQPGGSRHRRAADPAASRSVS